MGYVAKAFFRSFLIQSSWNFERMQSLGFFYSVAPAIRVIHKTKEALKEASDRHLEFFNTNPYMAPAIIGATIRMEEDGASGEEIKDLKSALMGVYGAVGDALFWGSLRPLAAVSGVAFALQGCLWAPLVFLLVYNLPHLFVRAYGMFMGYRLGIGVVNAIIRLDIPNRVKDIKGVTLFTTGVLLSVLFSIAGIRSGYGSNIWISVLLSLSVFGFYWGLERGIRVEALAALAVAVSVVLSSFL